MTKPRLVFFGTASLACPSLEAIARHPHFELTRVVTQPDRPAGRGLHSHASPVKSLAIQLGLTLDQPARCRDATFLQTFRAVAPDLAVVVAYGQILPRALLELAPLGFLNVHASLLPRYRGAAPIQWAILNGDTHTGVTIMKIDEGLDTGDILSTRDTPILDSDDALTLEERLGQLGASLLIDTLTDLIAGRVQSRAQPGDAASYARKITRADGHLDWNAPARDLWNRARALVPWPGTYTLLPDHFQNRILKIWKAEPLQIVSGVPGEILSASSGEFTVACRIGALRLHLVQCEGGRKMSARDFLAGHPLQPGQRLG